jgi:hypothetical protein
MEDRWLVICIVDGKLNSVKHRSSCDEAVKLATAMSAEQCDESETSIEEEIRDTGSYMTPDGAICVYVEQSVE